MATQAVNRNVPIAVDILLNATGNAPIMKTRKWAVDQEKPVSWVIRFIHKFLKLKPEDKLVSLLHESAVDVLM